MVNPTIEKPRKGVARNRVKARSKTVKSYYSKAEFAIVKDRARKLALPLGTYQRSATLSYRRNVK